MGRISWLAYAGPRGPVRGFTWNPVKGCSHAGYRPADGGARQAHPGCERCYAESFCKRNLHGEAATVGNWDGTLEFYPERLAWPFERWKARRDGLPRIGFTHSLSDPGHPNYPEEFWMAVQGAMLLSPWIVWKDLTKRPTILGGRLERWSPADCLQAYAAALWWNGIEDLAPLKGDDCYRKVGTWEEEKHIHRYVSVSDQATADALIPELVPIPAAVHGVSLEPLLGPVDLEPWLCEKTWRGIDHVMVGGESGRGARPCDLKWINSVKGACHKTNTPCYVKQLGNNPVLDSIPFLLQSSSGSDMAEWPEDLRVREHVGVPVYFGSGNKPTSE